MAHAERTTNNSNVTAGRNLPSARLREAERGGSKQRLSLGTLQSRGRNVILLHLNTFLFLLEDDIFSYMFSRKVSRAELSSSYLSCIVSAGLEPNFQLGYHY